ncbi:hypothetical protein AVO41_03780 [Thiomicrospira sp. WB1]|nr:hypothetical protein AVO41_03780 [Thiomicrospira sp. WB1]
MVEIALVLVIIGFVTTGLLRMFDGPRSSAKYVEDQQKLADVKASIMAYVARNRTLPCPDADNDGTEDVSEQHCDANEGFLPHQTLKTHARNAFGEPFYYVTTVDASASQDAVRNSDSSASYYGHTPTTPADMDDAAPYFQLKTPPSAQDGGEGLIFVCGKGVAEGNCSGSSQFEVSSTISAVVSFGANSDKTWKGTGSSYPSGGVPNCPAELTGAEQLNCDNATYSINGADHQLLHNAQQTKDGFDDALIWISAYEVKKLLGMGKRTQAPNMVSENNFQTSEGIEEFLNSTSTGGLDRTGGQSGWEEASDPRTITVNGDGDTEEVTVLTQTQDEERALFIEIPEGTDEYILHSIVELGSGDEGGYGIFFDTLLQNDTASQAVVDRGYVVQFNRGYSGAAENESSMLLRDWQEGENQESDDGPYDGAYFRYNDRPNSEGRSSDEGIPCKAAQTNGCPSNQTDDAWWQDIHKMTIKVTGVTPTEDDSDAESMLQRQVTVTVYDMVDYYGNWRPRFDFTQTHTLDPKDEFDSDRKLFTGFRTWSTPDSYFYEFDIERLN